MSYLQPMDTRQYLYCLKPKPEYAEKAGVIKGVTVIGKLDIVWKTNLGERGRLQTSQLQRMVPPPRRVNASFVPSQLPSFSHRRRDTETSGCPWRWFPTPSTWRSPSTSSARSPTAGRTTLVLLCPGSGDTACPDLVVAARGPWTWCWRCATPPPSTGAEHRGGSWASLAPPCPSPCRSRSSPPSRVCRYEPEVFRKRNVLFFFLGWGPNVLCLFLPEHFGIKTQRHFSEEDIRVRWHRTSVCDLPVPKQRTLGMELPSLVF